MPLVKRLFSFVVFFNFIFLSASYGANDTCETFFSELQKINTNNTIVSKRVQDGIGYTPGTN